MNHGIVEYSELLKANGAFELRGRLLDSGHFYFDEDILDFAQEVLKQNSSSFDEETVHELCSPSTSAPPRKNVTLSIEGFGKSFFAIHSEDNITTGQIGSLGNGYDVSLMHFEDDSYRPINIGVYTPNGTIKVWHQTQGVYDLQKKANLLHLVAICFSIINQPRITKTTRSGNKQRRSGAQKCMGFCVDAWHRVSWDVSKETVAKVSRDPNFHKKPLHWRRGHYRQAEPHYKGARQIHDALNPKHRNGWWQWIDDCWVGHPAFGTKLSYHAPKISKTHIEKYS